MLVVGLSMHVVRVGNVMRMCREGVRIARVVHTIGRVAVGVSRGGIKIYLVLAESLGMIASSIEIHAM
jgi:hypothetical protein